MSDRTSERDESDGTMDEYTYLCSGCGQEISVNSEMKRAILSNGCPVCATEATETDFEE